jgi:enoyl-CoA hydratase/carnithine racemase
MLRCKGWKRKSDRLGARHRQTIAFGSHDPLLTEQEATKPMTALITAAYTGAVGEICFAKPPHNFASADLLCKIADALDLFDADPAIRCVLLSSEGKSFCAGADLAGDEEIARPDGMNAVRALYDQALRIFRRKKPMVAAVQGAAVGAGLGLALTADFRVASSAARFSANFVRLGFHPGFGLTHTLPRLIGIQRAAWMMLSAERVKAEAAREWGLIDRLAKDDDVMTEARRMAEDIAVNAPLALVSVRATMTASLADDIAAAMMHEYAEQEKLKATSDYAEGVASVFERRDANFLGR